MLDAIKCFIHKLITNIQNEIKALRSAKVTLLCFCTMVVFFSVYGINSILNKNNLPNKVNSSTRINVESKEELSNKSLTVHVKGAVIKPGLYTLDSKSRINDAIKMAGGTTDQAELDYVNLAEFLIDGSEVYIPTKGDVESGNINKMTASTSKTTSSKNATPKPTPKPLPQPGSINLNTATVEQLCLLPGIGEKKALDICNYRQYKGSFDSINEIMNVKGIGNATFEKLKEYITV